ncbi:hypothetical protein ACIBF1_32795 [Spirillospora sp. NPDC050679]
MGAIAYFTISIKRNIDNPWWMYVLGIVVMAALIIMDVRTRKNKPNR